MAHTDIVDSALARLESRKSKAILIRLPLHTHKILKAYASSIGKPVSSVVSILIDELTEKVQHKFVVRMQAEVSVKAPEVTDDAMDELRVRFRAYNHYRMAHPGQGDQSAQFGLRLLDRCSGTNLNHFALVDATNTLAESSSPEVESALLPANGVVMHAGPLNGHTPPPEDTDGI